MTSELIPIGTETRWGKVQVVGYLTGERYYWMVNSRGGVAMMPADVVESVCRPDGQRASGVHPATGEVCEAPTPAGRNESGRKQEREGM